LVGGDRRKILHSKKWEILGIFSRKFRQKTAINYNIKYFCKRSTANINPFSGQTYEIAADLSEPLIIENFDPTKDSIQLPANPDSEVIPQFSFSDRYILTEINGDTAISTMIFAVNVSRSLCLQAYLQIIWAEKWLVCEPKRLRLQATTSIWCGSSRLRQRK
jgi:hypothetical protein